MLKGNIKTTLLTCALILNAVKNIRKEILNAINPENRWTQEIQVTQGKDQLRKRRKVTKAQRKRNTEGYVRDPDPVRHLHGPLIQSKRRNILRRLRRGRKAPQALTSPDLGLKNSLVQMREEELEGPFSSEQEGEDGAEATFQATIIATAVATMTSRSETEMRSGIQSTHLRARSTTCTMTGRAKVRTSGWTEAVVGVLSPEEEVASCSESQAPAPSGLMTNSVEKKEKLKMTKAEQRTERKRTPYRQRLNSRSVCLFPRALAGGKGFSTTLVLEIVRAILKCWAEPRRGALKPSRS